MKLVYICRNCTLDNGNSRIAWELAREAARRGHETHLVARRFPASGNAAEIRFHRVFQLPKIFGRWRALSFAWTASRRARLLGSGALTHSFGDSFAGDIFTIGNVDWTYERRIPGRKPSASALRIKRAALQGPEKKIIVIVSDQLRQDILDLAPQTPPQRIRVVYPGVDTKLFHPQRREEIRTRLQREKGIPTDAFWIASAAGGDLEKRNVATLAKALAQLRLKRRWVFIFGGVRLNQAAWPRSLEHRSFFLGPLADLSSMLPACDLFVYPAWFDEFAMVCLEAMACGIPVLLTRTTGASEIIPSIYRSLCVLEDPGNAEALARRIEHIVRDAPAMVSMGHSNRAVAEAFAWPSVYRAYENLYEELLASRPETVRA